MSLLWKGMVMLPTSKETVVRAPGSRTRDPFTPKLKQV